MVHKSKLRLSLTTNNNILMTASGRMHTCICKSCDSVQITIRLCKPPRAATTLYVPNSPSGHHERISADYQVVPFEKPCHGGVNATQRSNIPCQAPLKDHPGLGRKDPRSERDTGDYQALAHAQRIVSLGRRMWLEETTQPLGAERQG
jgi:hypothetical protein